MLSRTWQMTVIACGLVAPAIVWWAFKEPRVQIGSVYAYDTGTKQIYATNETVPPMAAPSGPQAGVRAQVVTFAGDHTPTVVYLTTYTPEAHESLLRANAITNEVVAGTMVSLPDDVHWVPINSPEGLKICARIKELAAGRTWLVAIPE
jgi:hypothetical protein